MIKFENNHVDSYHNQDYYCLLAYIDNRLVGYIDYSTYKNKIYIGIIKVNQDKRRQGIATELYKRLKYFYPKIKIVRGLITEDGEKFFNYFDKKVLTK